MKEVREPIDTRDTAPIPQILDQGAVSKCTRGVAWPFPDYELGIPPYDHFWPSD